MKRVKTVENVKKSTKTKKDSKVKSPNTTNSRKSISWAEFYHEYDEKKPFRSTPYPKQSNKKLKLSNIVPSVLNFDDSDIENHQDSFEITKSVIPNDKKRKRSKEISSEWTTTSCTNIKPDKSNKSLNLELNFNVSKLLSNLPKKCDKIIVESTLSPLKIEVNSEEELLDSNLNIFGSNILDVKSCQILQPTSEEVHNNDSSEILEEITEDLNKQKKEKRFQKEIIPFITENLCILILKHPLNLYFHGKLSVRVLSGALEVLGYILRPDGGEKEVYSPKGQSFLCLQTIKSEKNENLNNLLKDFNITTRQIKEILYKHNKNNIVIALRNFNNPMTNYLAKHVAQYLFPKPVQCEKKIEKKLHALFEISDKYWRVFKKNEDWDDLMKTTLKNLEKNHCRTMICGGKAVGKSMLLKYMINSLLNKVNRVVCIDLDPGQSEFTVCGSVSVTLVDEPVFGPNFTHLKNPLKSFYLGQINVTNCIELYIASIKELLNYCNQNLDKNIPWVVNFMGFSDSIGTSLTIAAIKLVSPNLLAQIESNTHNKNYLSVLTDNFVKHNTHSFPIAVPEVDLNYHVHVLQSLAEDNLGNDFEFIGRQLRELSILSYFSQILDSHDEITSVAPYSVKMSKINLLNLEYNEENICATINGSLVALCQKNSTTFTCFGFGIVRGIDKDSGELYLLTPVSDNQLENVDTLIKGNIDLPPSMYMTPGRQGHVPYILLGSQKGINTIPKRSFKNMKALLRKKT